MGKKLTNRQVAACNRVANTMGLSDQLVTTIVSEYLEQQPAPENKSKGKKKGTPEKGIPIGKGTDKGKK